MATPSYWSKQTPPETTVAPVAEPTTSFSDWRRDFNEKREADAAQYAKDHPSLYDLNLQNQLDETAFNKMLRPILLQNMGLMEETIDGKPSIRAMTEDEKYASFTPEQKTAYDLDKLATAEQLKYAEGKGEIPTSIEEQLAEQRKTSQGLLSQRLGPKAALSTPGIDTASKTSANELGVKSAFNYGNETQGLGLLNLSANNLYNQQLNQQNTGSLMQGGVGLPGLMATSQNPFNQQNNLNYLQDSLGTQKQNAIGSGIMQGGGSVLGMYLTKGMGGKK